MKRIALVLLSIIVLIYIFLCFSPDMRIYTLLYEESIPTIEIHTYKDGSQYHKFGTHLKDNFHHINNDIVLSVEKSDGSVQNLEEVNKDKYSIGFCQKDAFDPQKYENVKVVSEVHYEMLHIIVNCDSIDCNKISQIDINRNEEILKAIKLSTKGEADSGTEITMSNFIIELQRIWKTKFDNQNIINCDMNDALDELLENGKIYSAAIVTGENHPHIKRKLKRKKINGKDKKFKILEISKNLLDRFDNNFYKLVTTEFDLEDEGKISITTISVPALVIANKNIPDIVTKNIIEIINQPNIKTEFKLPLNEYELQSEFKNTFVSTNTRWIMFLGMIILPFVFINLLIHSLLKKSYKNKLNEFELDNESNRDLNELATIKNELELKNKKINELEKVVKDKEINIEDLKRNSLIPKQNYVKSEFEGKIQQLEVENEKLKSSFVRSLEIGINADENYYFVLNLADKNLINISYDSKDKNPHKVFKKLLSYAYAKKYNKEHKLPSLTDTYRDHNGNLIKDIVRHTKADIIHQDLFGKKRPYELRIKKENIKINLPKKIDKKFLPITEILNNYQ